MSESTFTKGVYTRGIPSQFKTGLPAFIATFIQTLWPKAVYVLPDRNVTGDVFGRRPELDHPVCVIETPEWVKCLHTSLMCSDPDRNKDEPSHHEIDSVDVPAIFFALEGDTLSAGYRSESGKSLLDKFLSAPFWDQFNTTEYKKEENV